MAGTEVSDAQEIRLATATHLRRSAGFRSRLRLTVPRGSEEHVQTSSRFPAFCGLDDFSCGSHCEMEVQ